MKEVEKRKNTETYSIRCNQYIHKQKKENANKKAKRPNKSVCVACGLNTHFVRDCPNTYQNKIKAERVSNREVTPEECNYDTEHKSQETNAKGITKSKDRSGQQSKTIDSYAEYKNNVYIEEAKHKESKVPTVCGSTGQLRFVQEIGNVNQFRDNIHLGCHTTAFGLKQVNVGTGYKHTRCICSEEEQNKVEGSEIREPETVAEICKCWF